MGADEPLGRGEGDLAADDRAEVVAVDVEATMAGLDHEPDEARAPSSGLQPLSRVGPRSRSPHRGQDDVKGILGRPP
ncbi:hypothetical protein [Nannocystis punicea]|uniref:hypothetical protein n=1 Tax=Nannocystis punicea TaxID=2995304 RepID=UPI0023E2E03E|nr:hypothetical protein [Nannocystis poenicansa]